jgi:hypothetical protein
VYGITHCIQILVLVYQYAINRRYPGIGWWLLWSAAEVAGFAFMLLREVPAIHRLAIIGQNSLIVSGVLFL